MGAKDSAAGVTLLASLAFFTVGSNLLAYAVVQEPIISEFKLSLTDSGLLVSVFFLMYSIMQIPGGYLADKWGGERTIALFTTFTALAAIGLSFATSFWLALVLRIAIGFGNGPLLPAAVRALTRRLQGHQLEVAKLENVSVGDRSDHAGSFGVRLDSEPREHLESGAARREACNEVEGDDYQENCPSHSHQCYRHRDSPDSPHLGPHPVCETLPRHCRGRR
ncbi:MAG: MFS transporter [Thaumarchaeota archaeon]|nr:MFS transporter [Nitrososphaerota archaeon]